MIKTHTERITTPDDGFDAFCAVPANWDAPTLYDEAAARTARERTMEFLDAHLHRS